jgi:hypothetical protein
MDDADAHHPMRLPQVALYQPSNDRGMLHRSPPVSRVWRIRLIALSTRPDLGIGGDSVTHRFGQRINEIAGTRRRVVRGDIPLRIGIVHKRVALLVFDRSLRQEGPSMPGPTSARHGKNDDGEGDLVATHHGSPE